MLVLSRRIDERIVCPDIPLTLQIVGLKSGIVRLGIEAPDHIGVFREELLHKAPPTGTAKPIPSSSASVADQLLHLLNNRLNASAIGLALLRRQLELGHLEEMAVTIDRIEANLRSVKERAERIAVDPARSSCGVRRRALVVEDDQNECELLAGFLRLAGLDVQTAGDGADALDYLNEKGKPDILLLDMRLPRCDGPTTVRTIRRNPAYQGLKIIGVTGASIEDFGLAEGPAGIDRWFRKPLDPEALLRELTRPDLCASSNP